MKSDYIKWLITVTMSIKLYFKENSWPHEIEIGNYSWDIWFSEFLFYFCSANVNLISVVF
jgi:hypothetical protein